MAANSKDIGVLITSAIDLINDDFGTFDWTDPDTPATGSAMVFSCDASRGFERIVLDTSGGRFLITITPLPNLER